MILSVRDVPVKVKPSRLPVGKNTERDAAEADLKKTGGATAGSTPSGRMTVAAGKALVASTLALAPKRTLRIDPDAAHRTGSLRDLFELCRRPGRTKELKEFLEVSPFLARRPIRYGS
jgi:hypothetical protein